MLQSVTPERTKLIEKLFGRYPDTPPELVIKQDLLILGVGFSEGALAAAAMAGVEKKSYGLFSGDLVPISGMQQKEYLKAPDRFVIKGGAYKFRPVSVRTRNCPHSPYVIDIIDGQLKLRLDGVAIADVGYVPAPGYYARSFPDGTPYGDVISVGWQIIAFRLCQMWSGGQECKFCDINENTRQVKKWKSSQPIVPVRKLEQVVEVANEIGREVLETEGYPAPHEFHVNGGAITGKLQGMREDDFYLRYVEAVKWGGPRRLVSLSVMATDKETSKRYHCAGVDRLHPNLEVWDKRLFEAICPGKAALVGWEEWVKRMVEAVDVFGDGNVYPNFVAGVEMAQPYGFKTVDEAVKSTTEGFRYLMSHGVMPHFGAWHPEPGTYLAKYDQPPAPLEYYIQLGRNYYENWKRYDLPLPHRIGACPDIRALGAHHSIAEDYLLMVEQRDYENRVWPLLGKAGIIWGCDPTERSAS